jgi:hypothetical protein
MQWQLPIVWPPSNEMPVSPPSLRLVADLLHLSFGALVVTAAAVFWPKRPDAIPAGIFAVFAFATIKDPIYDTIYEGDTYEASLLDTAEYLAGAAVAALAIYAARQGKHHDGL